MEVQKKVMGILHSLDDKIEVNRRINDNLEQQAQALFKSWFVDFEPFKDGEFVESELGMIPKGWRILSLTHIANFLNGLAMQNFRPDGLDKGIPVLKIKELGQGRCDSSSDLCSSSIDAQYKIGDGDVIFSWSGTLLVDLWCGGLCGLNQHLFKVTSKDYPKWFYYLWTKEHLKNFIHIAKDKAVTMGHIKRSHLEEAKVLLPPMNVLDCMTNMMHPILEETIVRKIESRRLSSLRDTLLPRLMSGELKINDISV
jgi:type I restriction enzyme S subunit